MQCIYKRFWFLCQLFIVLLAIGKNKVLTNCPVSSVAACYENPCEWKFCGGYPDAECHVDLCGSCKAVFLVNKQPVSCCK